MAKKTPSGQTTMFRSRVPQMPEGYYSSGPNPNLRRFVEEHAKPYDPVADNYDVPPFDQPITTTKATAIYNMHSYHLGKKPHDAIRQYIRHYTQPGDIVLDPFCGSGSTALAALTEERAAIAIDLSPAATFITKNYCTPVDVEELQAAFEELTRRVKPEIDWLHATRCDRCDGRAMTAYTVYSYVFQCPRCLERVPLFDCVDVPGYTASGKEKNIHACPHCHARGQIEEISTRDERFDAIPVLVSYLCEEGCRPARSERRHNDPDPKKRLFFEIYDLGKIREIESKPIPHWYPPHRMMNVESDTAPWGDKWRAGTSNFRTVADLFTKRNLWALAAYKKAAINSELKDLFDFMLTGSCLHGSRMSHHKEAGGGISVGTYYLPQSCKERNIADLLSRKYNDIEQAEIELASTIATEDLLVSTQSATNLEVIPSNSLDYIFTDPPYADKVQYGELNFVWEAWLNLNTHWHEDEIVVNQTRRRTDADWAHLMRQAMSECYRVLKPSRWISLCYHDTSEGTWGLLQDIMAEVGFIAESSTADALYIDTGQKSYNQYTAENVTKRDLVINFCKPRPDEVVSILNITGDEDTATFTEKARAILREALEAHPGSSADRLYDVLVSRMVRQSTFERHNFDELLNQVAEPVREPMMRTLFETAPPDLFGTHETVRWYLRDTAEQIDEAESARELAAAKRLESFMRTWLTQHPADLGVHYSDLFEQYLPVRDKPRRLLIDWLPEFFFKTEEGTWRPPADEAERNQLMALRVNGTLRRIKRFTNALTEGVPPAERDQPANAATAADWIRQCRRAGLYGLGRTLYEKGGFDFTTLPDELQVVVDEDYQLCVKRS